MKHIILSLAAFLMLAGCASTEVLKTSPESEVMVSVSRVPLGGPRQALVEAVEKAMDVCYKKGLEPIVRQSLSKACALQGGCGEARVYFVCGTEGRLPEMPADRILELRKR